MEMLELALLTLDWSLTIKHNLTSSSSFDEERIVESFSSHAM